MNYPAVYAGIEIPRSFDYGFIPSTRSLHEILSDAVEHGRRNPRHGRDCACMDELIYEIRQHIHRAIPEAAKIQLDPDPTDPDPDPMTWKYAPGEWERTMDAKGRIYHIMTAAARYL